MTLNKSSLVVISICLGLVAAFLTFRYLSLERARAERLSRPIQVVVALQPIQARTIIDPTTITLATRPAGTLPENCASSLEEVAGQVALATFKADEPITLKSIA